MAECAGATPVIDCYIKLPSGRTIQMDMLPGDTVQKIYTKISKEEKVPEDRVMIKYTGKILNKTHTVGYLGVCAETILKAEILQIKPYTIYVKLPNGKTISLDVENITPIRTVKYLLYTQEDIPVDKQILKFGAHTLSKSNERLHDAAIHNEAVLELEVRSKAEKSTDKKKTTKKSKVSKRRGSADSTGSDVSGSDEESVARNGTDIKEDEKETVLNTFDARGKSVEVVFSFDTTGSMYACLDKVRKKLKESVERLIQHIPTIRIGIIAHGDYCDYSTYVLRMVDLTSNVEELVKFVDAVPSTGGGDAPECYEWVLHKACFMDWAEDSAKALIVIGDCIPHPPSYTDQDINWHSELDLLKGMGVKVYGVKALSDNSSLPFYQELADRTGGAFISFNNFDIISEMFLAVCYREASDEQYDAFCEEILQSEDQSEACGGESKPEVSTKVKDIQNVLSQLDEQKTKSAEDKPTRYVNASWWDFQLDNGNPCFTYNQQKDVWAPFSSNRKNLLRVKPLALVTRSSSVTMDDKRTKKPSRARRSLSLRITRRRSHKATSEEDTVGVKKHHHKKGCIVM